MRSSDETARLRTVTVTFHDGRFRKVVDSDGFYLEEDHLFLVRHAKPVAVFAPGGWASVELDQD